MTLRTMLGIGWSILCGLAGGWLVLMPWALNVQGDGDWTTVTKGAFWTGLILLAVCLIGLLVTIGLVLRSLAPARPPQAKQAEQSGPDQAELDRALLQIATRLATDLNGSSRDGHVPDGDGVLTHRGASSE